MGISPTHSLANKEDRKVKASLMPSGVPRVSRKNKEAYERTESLIEEIYVDISNGESKSNILRKIKLGLYNAQDENKPPKDHNFPYEVYDAAMSRILEDYNIKKDEMKALVFSQFLEVYRESVTLGDHHAALRALENIGKMVGAYDDKGSAQIQVNAVDGVKITFGFDKPIEDESEL